MKLLLYLTDGLIGVEINVKNPTVFFMRGPVWNVFGFGGKSAASRSFQVLENTCAVTSKNAGAHRRRIRLSDETRGTSENIGDDLIPTGHSNSAAAKRNIS